MKTYQVDIPITGVFGCTVTVPDDADEDDIFEAAVESHHEGKEGEVWNLEWEFTQAVTTGNVTHAMMNEWEFSEVKK